MRYRNGQETGPLPAGSRRWERFPRLGRTAWDIVAWWPVELGDPDETLDHAEHGPFLQKWHLARGEDGSGTLLHRFLRPDADLELHDHPWDNSTLVLSGGYWDVTRSGRTWLDPGARVHRHATDFHRVDLEPGVEPVTLFSHGPKKNAWGFLTADGRKVPWREFTAASGSFREVR